MSVSADLKTLLICSIFAINFGLYFILYISVLLMF